MPIHSAYVTTCFGSKLLALYGNNINQGKKTVIYKSVFCLLEGSKKNPAIYKRMPTFNKLRNAFSKSNALIFLFMFPAYYSKVYKYIQYSSRSITDKPNMNYTSFVPLKSRSRVLENNSISITSATAPGKLYTSSVKQ